MNLRLLLQAGAVMLAALLVGCASAPPADRYVAPPLGATWTIEHNDSGSYGNGLSQASSRMATRSVNGRDLLAFEGTQQTLVALPNGNWVGFMAPDGRMLVSFEPANGWDWPLAVGKGWSREGRIKFHVPNREVAFQSNAVVEAVEQVTVPGGTYWTYRIRTRDTLGSDNVIWFAPEVGLFVKQSLTRSAQHPQGAGRRDSQLMVFKAPQRY